MTRVDARRWGPYRPATFVRPRRLRALASVGLLAALFFALPAPSLAQPARLRFDSLTVEEGLSDSWVRSILKDHRGFLWFATRDGLSRYDGYGFRVYRHDPQDPHSLASSDMWALVEDDRKRLWAGGEGLHLYDRDRDRFEHVALDQRPGETAGTPAIRAMCADRSGHLWIGTQDSLLRFDPASRTSAVFRNDPQDEGSLRPGSILALACGGNGTLWIGTTTGLDRHDDRAHGFEHLFGTAAGPGEPSNVMVRGIHLDPDGTVWLAARGRGLVRLDPRDGAMQSYRPDPRDPTSIGEDRIVSVLADGKGTVYAGGERGLHVLDTATGRFRHSAPDPNDPSSLTSASIWSLFLDDQEILWIGTFNGGVNTLSAQGQRFAVIRAGVGGLADPHVLALIEDHAGAVWIGTDGGGLHRLDPETGHLRHYRHDPTQPDGLSSDSILALAEDRQERIWIGTWAGGLQRLDPRSDRFTSVPVSPSGTRGNVTALLERRSGELVVGTAFSSTYILERGAETFVALDRLYAGLTGGVVSVLAEDQRGDLWIGVGDPSIGGVDRVAQASGQVTTLRHRPEDADSLSRGSATAIHPDSRGNVWIGTDYGGLNVVENGSERFRHYTMADGLPTNAIAHILEDGRGGLWISTTKGLVWFENGLDLPDRPRFLTFDVHDGVQGNELRRGAGLRTRGGRLYFGGQRGVTHFMPEAIRRNPTPPPVVLTDLKIFNRAVPIGAPGSPLTRSITETPALVLSHRQSVVTFELAALNFVAPEKNRYAYKLEGFDRDWNEVGTQRTAPYTNLPPGDFTLRVRASNNDGVWNDHGIALPIHVTPPFWRTRWFHGMTAVALLASIGIVHRLRVRHHVRTARELRTRIEEATAQIKTLRGMLPVCSWCNKVRDDSGYWNQLEVYVREHTQAEFSHGICPDCRARYFPKHAAGSDEKDSPSES